VLLRPFFDPPEDKTAIMDAEKWTLNTECEWFPASLTVRRQMFDPERHPDLKLETCMVDIPRMYPDDTVWWRNDVSHFS
jgi:hypothetical protein